MYHRALVELAKIEAEIDREGKLACGEHWFKRREALTGECRRAVRASMQIAGMRYPAGHARLIVIGKAPEGYGHALCWDRSSEAVLCCLYINAADPNGILIQGLRKGDTVSVISASGMASFANEMGNPFFGGLVTVMAAGDNVILNAFDLESLADVIDAGEAFALRYFGQPEESEDETRAVDCKLRDAYGVTNTGRLAQQEGGILVCLPEQGGTVYSSETCERRWLKSACVRCDDSRPAHALGSFFARPCHTSGNVNQRTCVTDGDACVIAWDGRYSDNKGFYKVLLGIRQGGRLPDARRHAYSPN